MASIVPARLRNLEFMIGVPLLALIIIGVLTSELVFPGGADRIDLAARLTPPFASLAHPLGTDPLGRDVLARVLAGGRISLMVGVISVLGGVILGVTLGLIAGYFRGIAEMAVMRLTDVQMALPFILLAIIAMAIVRSGLATTIALLIVAQWVHYARVVRASVLTLREREFVQSAHAIGVGHFRIILDHLLPNLMGPVIVLMTLNVANNILLESSLTFLGLGIDPTIPSWGGMLAEGRTYLQSAWWVSVFPGVAILLTVLALNLIGDWMRDTLDPMGRTST